MSFIRRYDGRFFGTVRVDFETKVDSDRAVNDGINVGYSRIKGEYWEIGSRSSRCFNCQRYSHLRSMCKFPTRCAKCGDEHDVKVCTSVTVSCPNCSLPHMAWNSSCAFAIHARQRAASQLGLGPSAGLPLGFVLLGFPLLRLLAVNWVLTPALLSSLI